MGDANATHDDDNKIEVYLGFVRFMQHLYTQL